MTSKPRPDKQAISTKCRNVMQAAEEALGWIDANRELVSTAAVEVKPAIHRQGRRARRLNAALDRPVCLALYGPSQSGKSYLVSALGAAANEPITVVFPGAAPRAAFDFLSEINPEGEKESTGLVTRFSGRPLIAAPPETPVSFRLLTPTDVLKVLANTFALDGDEADTTPLTHEDVVARMAELEGIAPAGQAGPLSADDILDVQEYVEETLKNRGVYRILSSAGYWTMAARLVPKLPFDKCLRLLSLLWGDNEAFSDLYARLYRVLASLEFADHVFAGLEALMPRETSVIDVNALNGLNDAAAGELTLATPRGKRVVVPRPVAAALIAELQLAMRDTPHAFLADTDIIDFPGARSRLDFNRLESYLKRPGALEGLYLRGKVAYLFDRYSADQEITCMLLCLQPGNQEVSTLPSTISNWVARTHGATPGERIGRPALLFLVLTKFDLVLKVKKGQSDTSEARWTNRIETAIDSYLAKAFDWPLDWTPGKPFDNSFWLRNPGVLAPDLFEYNGKTETAVRESERDRLESYRVQHASNPLVIRSFADPRRAWEAAFKLNDGGVSYLIERLADVCNPRTKLEQINGQIDALSRAMLEPLSRYHFEDDTTADLRQRMQRATDIVTHAAGVAEGGLFGQLIEAFQIDPAQLEAEHNALLNRPKPPGEAADARLHPGSGRLVRKESILKLVMPGAVAPPAASEPTARHRDEAEAYAAAALEGWARDTAIRVSNESVSVRLGLPGDDLATIRRELVAAAERLNLGARIAEGVRNILLIRQNPAKRAAWPAMVAAELINNHVFCLGFNHVPEASRPTIGPIQGRDVPIFEYRKQDNIIEQLTEEPSAYEEIFIASWLRGFMHLVDANVQARRGQNFDVEQNKRLGDILDMLKDVQRTEAMNR